MRLFRALTMAGVLAALAGVTAATAQPSSPPPADPALLALPAKLITALTAGDAATYRATCAPNAVVVDEFPPYAWSGADSCGRYVAGFKAFTSQMKMTNIGGSIKGKPFVDTSGNRAFVTAQVLFNATMGATTIHEQGLWTFVLVKSAAGWKVTNMAFGVLHH